MIFHTRIDAFFLSVMTITVLIIGSVCFLPLFVDPSITPWGIVILLSLFSITVGFMIWILFSIRYIVDEDDLLVKGGPFKSRIAYKDITKVSPTRDIYTGYRLLTARKALEIFYTSGTLGSVKISPKDQERFLAEIEKRCPHVRMNQS